VAQRKARKRWATFQLQPWKAGRAGVVRVTRQRGMLAKIQRDTRNRIAAKARAAK
jgi:hypothetical protein